MRKEVDVLSHELDRYPVRHTADIQLSSRAATWYVKWLVKLWSICDIFVTLTSKSSFLLQLLLGNSTGDPRGVSASLVIGTGFETRAGLATGMYGYG